MTLLWKKPSWPSFYWNNSELFDSLVQARFNQAQVLALRNQFVHSYEISDVKRFIYEDLVLLGPLNNERLNGWQASLFPTGYSGVKKVRVGHWRDQALALSTSKNAFALEAQELAQNFQLFLDWWQEPPVHLDPLARAAIAFFWFISISPFEDGNYTLACALSELTLQENEKTSFRLYDLSLQLEEQRPQLLDILKRSQAGDGDLTEWILFFLELHQAATSSAYAIAKQDLQTSEFWKSISTFDLNSRQKIVLSQLFDQSLDQITNRDYVAITNTSRESAKRDLSELVRLGLILKSSTGGRSVFYTFIRPSQ